MSAVRSVVRAMERIAPLRLAESWDNVGLLLEAPNTRQNAKRILLTIDLTPGVVEEALSTPTSVIISYHPPIFRPLTALTLSNPLQSSLLKCVAAGISVFSPHTALDSVKGGINDWLAEGLGRETTVRVIEPKEGIEGTGAGRIVTFQDSTTLEVLAKSIKAHLGLKHIQIARSIHDTTAIQSVAICAGSGGSMLKDINADVYFTGEMSHHEVLSAIAKGTHVILCGHDNTERGYLPTLKINLGNELRLDPGGPFEVVVSERDKHPLDVV